MSKIIISYTIKSWQLQDGGDKKLLQQQKKQIKDLEFALPREIIKESETGGLKETSLFVM